MERYDYLRAEYYKENGRWPYTPRPLTNYEKAVMYGYLLLLDAEYSYLRRKTTYADFYLSDLYKLAKPNNNNESLRSLLSIKDKLKSKGKDFSKTEVEAILSSIYTIYDYERLWEEDYSKKDVVIVRLLKNEKTQY